MLFTGQSPIAPHSFTPPNEDNSARGAGGGTPKCPPNRRPCTGCSRPSVKSKCNMSYPWSTTLCQRCGERGIPCVTKPEEQKKITRRKPHRKAPKRDSTVKDVGGTFSPTTPTAVTIHSSSEAAGPAPAVQYFETTFQMSSTHSNDAKVAEMNCVDTSRFGDGVDPLMVNRPPKVQVSKHWRPFSQYLGVQPHTNGGASSTPGNDNNNSIHGHSMTQPLRFLDTHGLTIDHPNNDPQDVTLANYHAPHGNIFHDASQCYFRG
ncbi:hypothetical protein BD410DRAFT_498682 [Rickenella mellea]|uniref:Uncharacterized protein n=1 Tax=Rickenella mellea TaxID=50990 RepID=A0A4Y7PSZ6_9AGAM|nr:hypothetical protein BD410DRAFT_498682 [Rickenella mellea]